MGPSVDPAEDDIQTRVKSLTGFEIVGPPGAGKTTLALELRDRHNQFHLRQPPDWKKIRYLPFYVKNSLAVTPAIASLTFGSRGHWLNHIEFFWLVFLNGWHRQLTRPGPDSGLIILDQGPVYMLSQMILCRERQMMNPLFKKWWRKILDKWGQVLEIVVRLDASDTVLAQRINTRGKYHIIKGASLPQTRDFLEQHRVALDQAMAQLRADRCTPAVVCFDTGRQSLNEIAAQLYDSLISIRESRAR